MARKYFNILAYEIIRISNDVMTDDEVENLSEMTDEYLSNEYYGISAKEYINKMFDGYN